MVFAVKKVTSIDRSGDVKKLVDSVVDLAKYCEDEFAEVATALKTDDPGNINAVPPARPRTAQLVYADGTHWNPGSGEGYYFQNSAGLWVPAFSSAPTLTAGSGISIVGSVISEDTAQIGQIKWFPFTRAPNANYQLANGTTVLRASFPGLLANLIHSHAVTFTNASANIGWTAHGFPFLNEPIKFYTTGTLPTNFTAGTPGTGGTFYYIKSIVDANTITVSLTPGGTVITAGSAGTGTHTGVNAPWGDGDNSTTFHLPQLLGEHVRAWDAQRGIDVNRGFGADQLDSMQGHIHQDSGHTHGIPTTNTGAWSGSVAAQPPGTTTFGSLIGTFVLNSGNAVIGSPVNDGSNGVPRTGIETRPRNQTLMPFIRVL